MANTTVKGKFNVVAENGDVQTIYPKTTGDQVLVDRSSNASVIPNDVANLQHIVNKMGSLALKSKVETSDFTTGTMISSIADLKSNTETGKIADATVVKDIESRVDTLENSNLVTVDELDAGLATKPDTEINDSVTSTSLTWSSKKLSDQLTALNSNTSILTSRVNTITALPDGATTNDARLEDICVGYDNTVYNSPGESVRNQVNEIHTNLTDLSTDLNDKITKVKNFTKIIVPMTYCGVGISSSNNNTVTFTQNKNGSTHIMFHHAVGNFGVGFKLSNSYLEYKNRKLDVYVKSPNDVSFTAYLYIADSVWGEAKHKGNVSDPNTSNGYVAAVSSTGVRINNDCCKFTIGTDTDTFWDNDNFCLLLNTTVTYGDYEMDILITDSTDIFDIPEKPIKTGGYIELKNRFSKATLYYADMPSHTNIINTIPSENRNHIFINNQTDFTSYSFVFTPYTIENTDITRLWIYDIFFIKITDFIGKNYSVKISIYSNDSKIDYINHAHITTNVVSWANNVKTLQSETISSKCKIINFNTKDVLNTIDESKSYYICIGYDSNHYPDADRNIIYSRDTTIDVDIEIVDLDNTKIIATELIDFDKSKYYTKSEINEMINIPTKYITCWGDSLTEGGGWTSRLQELTGMTVYNGGTGGESSKTICSRQGADAMVVNNITIPADTSNVLIASRTDDIGITTVEGNKVTPLLQGGSHVNPCKIGDIEGTLRWTGSNYADTSGTWVFKRSTAGDSSITINRPTVLRTNYDMNRNNPYLMIIFIGQNGGWDNDLDTLVRQHRLMIEHANAEHVIILGLSSGNTSTRTEYETRMKQEFGRYFISLREYLSTPIYENGEIVSCYGIEDQNAEIDMDYVATNASGKTVKQEITDGIVPHAILTDGVHYTAGTKTVIGDLIYKRCKELNIF